MIDMTRVKRLNKLLTDQATAIYLPIVHLNKSVDRTLKEITQGQIRSSN